MATLIYDRPERYALAYNDNPYVIRSTNYSPTQRWRVTLVDAALTELATVTVYPRRGVSQNGSVTEDRTYFDPSRILQSLITTPVDIPSSGHSTYFDCLTISKDYAVVFNEQEKVNGVYENIGVEITDLRTVWNGGLKKIDWLTFEYEDYDYAGGIQNRYLTQAPSTQYLDAGQSAFLYFLDSSRASTTLTLESFTNGVSGGTADLTFSMGADFGYFAIGYDDIKLADTSNWSTNPFTLIQSADYYTITLDNGETFTYYINARCSKYTPVRLHWLNRLGGFDSFNFSLKSEESTDIDRRSYLSQEHDFTGTRWQYDTSSRGQTDYHVGTQRKLTINTPFLTEAESVWMEDFATSPEIYQEVSSNLIAMSSKVKMIDKQTSLNNKLMQYTFELEYSLNDMRQRG